MNVIQIGYGYWGANIARKLTESPVFDLAALCEVNPARAQQARLDLPDTTDVTDDYTQYLSRPDIEGMVIATQTEYSFEYAMRGMEAGKHIFIEKPIATTAARAEKLKRKAEETGLILHCDHIMLYNPYYRYIKSLIDAGELGELGELRYYETDKLNLGPIRKDVNALMDLAVHDVALLDWYLDGKAPKNISAIGLTPFGNQETMTYLTLTYDGFMAGLRSSWISPEKIRRTVIAGSKKMVVFDDMLAENKLKVYDCRIDIGPDETYTPVRGDVFIPDIPFEDSIRNSLEWWADCVRTGTQSPSGPEPSLRVMRILEAAQKQLGK